MSENISTLNDLYILSLQDLYSAETQLIEALPKMSETAVTPELKKAFKSHLQETQQQQKRLEKLIENCGEKPGKHVCQAMKGLVKEGQEMIEAKGDDVVRDAGLIAAAQRVEHYEIAGYGCTKTYARLLGLVEDAKVLQTTLDEEFGADDKLTEIAESLVNKHALKTVGTKNRSYVS